MYVVVARTMLFIIHTILYNEKVISLNDMGLFIIQQKVLPVNYNGNRFFCLFLYFDNPWNGVFVV